MTTRNEPQSWASYNLRYKAGTTKNYTLRYKVAGAPLNLTGYTATFQIKVSNRETLTRTVGSGITLGGAAGTIVVSLTPTFTASIPTGRHTHYLEIVSPTGEQIPVMDGTFTVVSE